MKAPDSKRFLLEDYPDAPIWFGKFINVLNRFMEQTIQLFSGRISLGENIQSREFSTSFTTSGTYTSGDFESIQFSWNGSQLPFVLLISRIVREDGVRILTPVGVPEWRTSTQSVTVSYIAGLANNTKYQVSFLVL